MYKEFSRILKPGGEALILTPNVGDYSVWLSKIIPNRYHGLVVKRTEGRDDEKTFPTFYRSNSARRVRELAMRSGFAVSSLKYLGQYPCYFLFSPALFVIATVYEKLISRYDQLRFLRGWLFFSLKKR